jgi:cytochrome P450
MLAAGDEQGRTLSRRAVRYQMVTFRFAGHDTTSLG